MYELYGLDSVLMGAGSVRMGVLPWRSNAISTFSATYPFYDAGSYQIIRLNRWTFIRIPMQPKIKR